MAKAPTAAQHDLYLSLRGKFKKIKDYTDEELDATVAVIAQKHPNFYEILNGVDAYLEKRRRKEVGDAITN